MLLGLRFLSQEAEVDQDQEVGASTTKVVAKEMERKIWIKKGDHIKILITQGRAIVEAHNKIKGINNPRSSVIIAIS
jgi:hypothetical protein